MLIYPLPDLLDRISISKLKVERNGEQSCINEYNTLIKEVDSYGFNESNEYIEKLYEVNKKIWDLESDIRKCKEDELGLEEVPRRAIQIRKINKERISIKNEIANKSKSGFIDVKMNHGSE